VCKLQFIIVVEICEIEVVR